MTNTWRPVVRVVAAATVVAQVGAAQTPTPSVLPEGTGKAPFLRTCGGCHGPESAIAQLKTPDEWRKTLDEMAANGAEATDDEWTDILGYLDAHFSLILVNTAAGKVLAKAFGVPDAEGDAIVRYRDEHGRFATADDLKNVPGLDATTIESRKDRLVF